MAEVIIERQTLRIPEVAKILDISRAKAYDMAAKGQFPAIQIGGRDWRVPKKAFEDWLAKAGFEKGGGSVNGNTPGAG